MSEPYAYQAWHCSRCDGELAEENDGTLLCETDGLRFRIQGAYTRAELIPDSDDD